VYYAFDLLYFDGFDTRSAPLLERKRVLQCLLSEHRAQRIFYSEHFENGTDLYARATEMNSKASCPRRGTRRTARADASIG
jgi:bifunctional non-homologous end joining protein LigD